MIDRLLRIENLVVIPLLLVVVLVALGARWRGDSRYGRIGSTINVAIRLGSQSSSWRSRSSSGSCS